MALPLRVRSARGAVLVHVAVLLVALVAFSALAIDWGIQLVARTQAQGAADAAALAAAISRSFVSSTDVALAQNAAVAAAQRNQVWGANPDVLAADITFPVCPPGAPGVPDTCVRANVYRTNYQRANGSPLPTIFAGLVGVNDQGARATATAQMRAGVGTSDCVKPWGLADRWHEVHNPATEFNRYVTNGNNAGQVINNPDTYNQATDGWRLPANYGERVLLYNGQNPQTAISPGFFYPVRLDGQGGHDYQFNISGCNTTPIVPGMVLQPEPGRMVGPTGHGFEDLIALDPTASWSTTLNRPVGGCMDAGTCTRSPRWVAVPVFDVDAFLQAWIAGGGGSTVPVTVVRVIGLWIDEVRNNNNIYGFITHYPTVSITGAGNDPGPGAFARTVILVR